MTKLIHRCGESIKHCRKRGGEFCITDTKLLMHIMLYNIPGEWSYSTDLMWKEQEVPARVIGVNKSAGVRKADGTLNDSWCRVRYLWTLNLRPTERARTQLLPNSESRGRKSPPCCSVMVLYNTVTEGLGTRLKSVLLLKLSKCMFLDFELILPVYFVKYILFTACFCIQISPLLSPSFLFLLVAEPMVPLLRPWWMEMDIIVLGTVGCASVVFLLSAIIICYKAIKRLDVTFSLFSHSILVISPSEIF